MVNVADIESCALTLSDCDVVLQKCLNVEKVRASSYSVRPLSDKIAGYMGKHLILTIQYFCNKETQEERKEKVVFLKSITDVQNPFVELFPDVHHKEIGLYNFVDEFCATHGSDLNVTARLYLDHPASKTMVMEDLRADGFVMPEGRQLDLDHMRVSCDAVARFHAITIIHEHEKAAKLGRKYCLWEDHSDWMEEGMFAREHPNGYRYSMAAIRGICSLEEIFPLDERLTSEAFKNGLRKSAEKLFDLFDDRGKRFRAVLNHGDLWSKNMLFSHDGEGKPIGCRLVDFQLVRYAPPALDLTVFIYHSMDKDAFSKSYDKLLEFYYDSLRKHLSGAKLDVELELPKQEFLRSCEVYMHCSRVIQAIYRTMSAASDAKFKKLCEDRVLFEKCLLNDRSDFVLDCFRNEQFYRELMTSIMHDIRDLIVKEIQ